MSKRQLRKPRPAPVPTIVPIGDVGRFRVCYPDGSRSEAVTLAEAREMMKAGAATCSGTHFRE